MNHLYKLSFASGLCTDIVLDREVDSQSLMTIATAMKGQRCNACGYAGTTDAPVRAMQKQSKPKPHQFKAAC